MTFFAIYYISAAQLPWNCGFESGFYGMIQSTDDDFNWSMNNGSTATQETGPEHAAQGEWYIYIETSSLQREGHVAM